MSSMDLRRERCGSTRRLKSSPASDYRMASTRLSSDALCPNFAPLSISSPASDVSCAVTITFVPAPSGSKVVAHGLRRPRAAAICKTNCRLGIVRRQIRCRTDLSEVPNCVQCRFGSLLSGADAIHCTSEHQNFIVRGIAGEKDRPIILLDHYGDMISSMTRSGDCDHISATS
jgi:hypothetical protein